MDKIFWLVAFFLITVEVKSQEVLKPGSSAFNGQWIREGKSEMGYYLVNGNKKVEICNFTVDLTKSDMGISLYTSLKFLGTDQVWLDTCVLNKDLIPQYRSSHRGEIDYSLWFTSEITGNYRDKKSNIEIGVKEKFTEPFFESYSYPYLIGMLPLKSGYKAHFPVYEYKPERKENFSLVRIEEVKSSLYVSSLTGEHQVWQISAVEDGTGDLYEYFIDKEDRRIWKIQLRSGNQNFLLLDKEIDFNPFTAKFDKQATMDMITKGTSVIMGEVFARDNENEGALKGMAVLNINKKQHAPQGTSVVLIPYTAYFKEWMELNETARKEGRSIPLAEEAAACIKVTAVYDDKGSFEFVNLMPGEYLLYTEFGYVHTTTQTEVVGYTDTYINGLFQGSSANTETYKYGTNASANVSKTVKISTAGEILTIKLKKTL